MDKGDHMQKLIKGLHHFKNEVFPTQKDQFKKLAQGQSPEVLFITCSDSRINPNLITQTLPGELFIIRNAGNIIPPYGQNVGGEIATIEYAIEALNVKDIVVCGHSHCGAMKGLLEPHIVSELPAVKEWLKFGEPTRRVMKNHYSHLKGEALLTATVEENVLMQLENLETHPAVISKVRKGEIRLHAWVYKIETGVVYAYNKELEEFLPINEVEKQGDPKPITI